MDIGKAKEILELKLEERNESTGYAGLDPMLCGNPKV